MTVQDDERSEPTLENAHQPGQPPVIENHFLPSMTAADRVEPIPPSGLERALMGTEPLSDSGGPGRMAPVDQSGAKGRETADERQGQQQRPRQSLAESPLSYVRLRVHYDKGKLTIVGAREVAGPLTVPGHLSSGLTYEVLAEERRIGLGSLPDANAGRAFTNIDQEDAALGHNPRAFDSYDFDVRVPKSELAAEKLPSIHLHLHDIDPAAAGPLAPAPIRAQLGDAVKTLASLPGINVKELESTAQVELSRILGLEQGVDA